MDICSRDACLCKGSRVNQKGKAVCFLGLFLALLFSWHVPALAGVNSVHNCNGMEFILHFQILLYVIIWHFVAWINTEFRLHVEYTAAR